MKPQVEYAYTGFNPFKIHCPFKCEIRNICYAVDMDKRFHRIDQKYLDIEILEKLKKKKSFDYPIFLNPITEIFHESIPKEWLMNVFDITRVLNQRFIVHTKLPENAEEFFSEYEIPQNLALGVSVTSSKFLSRIDILRKIEARWHLISFEPAIDFKDTDFNPYFEGIDGVIIGGYSRRQKFVDPNQVDKMIVFWLTKGTVFVKSNTYRYLTPEKMDKRLRELPEGLIKKRT